MRDMTGEEQTAVLSPSHRRFLYGNGQDTPLDAEMYEQIRDRVAAVTRDFTALYSRLRDEDITAIFGDETARTGPAPVYDALIFLFYSMSQTDQPLEPHINLQHAYAETDQHAKTYVDSVCELFLPPQQCRDTVTTDGFDPVSVDAFERLCYDEAILPEAFDGVDSEASFVPSAEEVREMREETADLERIPLSVVLDGGVTTADPAEGRDE